LIAFRFRGRLGARIGPSRPWEVIVVSVQERAGQLATGRIRGTGLSFFLIPGPHRREPGAERTGVRAG
jgi:hypothetical protein